jgi:competence protein ComEA
VFTSDERRALVFLAVVTAAGAAFRTTRPADAVPLAGAAVAPELQGGDIVRQAAQSRRAEAMSRPLAPGERVDVDRAPADELQRLPRVGPALARRIVEERESHGPFGSLAALGRVTGVGPRLMRDLESHVSFGGVAPASTAAAALASPRGAVGAAAWPLSQPATGGSTGRLVWAASSVAGSPAPAPKAAACAAPPDLNHATVADLLCLPGVGRVLAERIVAERTAHGPFRDIADLARVRGFGTARIERLRNGVTIP